VSPALGVNREGFLPFSQEQQESTSPKAYGSGYFGEWTQDSFGLPAFRYTCDQTTDPRAISPTHAEARSSTDQTHQVGNDRLVAAVSNYGYVQVRQDEGSPKFLNDYAPRLGQYGAGIGYLTDGHMVLSTYYPGQAKTFERVFGVGYFRKTTGNGNAAVDQVKAVELRREFGERFAHRFSLLDNRVGLLESKHFLGRTDKDVRVWPRCRRCD